MIKTIEDCKEVQRKRVEQGKQGYSKSVRNFIKEEAKLIASNEVDWEKYDRLKRELPVHWKGGKERHAVQRSATVRANARVLARGQSRPFELLANLGGKGTRGTGPTQP